MFGIRRRPLGIVSTQPGYTPKNLTANGSTLLKTGTGVLHTLMVNKAGASANTCTIYDGTDNTGTVIATIDTTANIAPRVYDAAFKVGLYVVLASGTAGDVTLTYA